MDQSYQPITLAKADLLTVVTVKDGKFCVSRLKQSGKMMCWAANQVSFFGLNGFLASIGLRGAIIRVPLVLGLLCINNVLPPLQASTLIVKCLRCTIQIKRG